MEPPETLKTWVREAKVTWELSPQYELSGHEKVQVGFELRLFARHADSAKADPGCPECLRLWERLRAVAESVLPKEHRPTRYDVEPFHASFHLRPESHWTPEVQLTLRIVHREGYLRPLDECERRCAEEIQQGLGDLGAQPKAWSESRVARDGR